MNIYTAIEDDMERYTQISSDRVSIRIVPFNSGFEQDATPHICSLVLNYSRMFKRKLSDTDKKVLTEIIHKHFAKPIKIEIPCPRKTFDLWLDRFPAGGTWYNLIDWNCDAVINHQVEMKFEIMLDEIIIKFPDIAKSIKSKSFKNHLLTSPIVNAVLVIENFPDIKENLCKAKIPDNAIALDSPFGNVYVDSNGKTVALEETWLDFDAPVPLKFDFVEYRGYCSETIMDGDPVMSFVYATSRGEIVRPNQDALIARKIAAEYRNSSEYKKFSL